MIFVLAAAGAFGQPQNPAPYVDANVPPATRWTHHLPFSEAAEGVRSAVFAPDRPSVYVHMTMPVFDAWRALVWYWPELLGAALGVATIIALLIAWRLSRRRQRAGAPHCRKCNYDLSPQIARDERGRLLPPADAGARCPECGVQIARARPVRGRRTWVRLAPLGAAWMLLAGGYGALWIGGVPREGRASYWFDWSSASLAASIKGHGVGALAKFVAEGDRVVEVDLRTGAVTRVVTTRRSRTWSEISVTPDGAGLILAGDRGGTLQLISTRTGRRMAVVGLPGAGCPTIPRERTVIGYSKDGKTAYVQWGGDTSRVSGVSEWKLATDEVIMLAQDTADIRNNIDEIRAFLVRPGSPVRVVSFPRLLEASPLKRFVLRFHDTGNATPVKEVTVTPAPVSTPDPRVTSDGAAMFVVSEHGGSILRVRLDDPRTVDALSAGAANQFGDDLVLSRDDHYLVVGSRMRGLLVRDMLRRHWVATLDLPSELYAPTPDISADNRWVAAVAQTGDGRKAVFRHELVLWDLGQNPGMQETSDARPPATDDSE